MSGEKALKKDSSNHPLEMNNNAQDELPLLKSTKNGEKEKSITWPWNQQKNRTLIHDSAHFFQFCLLL